MSNIWPGPGTFGAFFTARPAIIFPEKSVIEAVGYNVSRGRGRHFSFVPFIAVFSGVTCRAYVTDFPHAGALHARMYPVTQRRAFAKVCTPSLRAQAD